MGPGAFRLLLACIVFAHHTSRVALGSTAVYVFLFLSGYWICRMWTSRYAHRRHPYRTFVLSRAWRLLPVFLLVNLLAAGVSLALGTGLARSVRGAGEWLHAVVANLLILGYGTSPYHPLGPAWSLDVEMQYYVFAPLLVLALLRSRPAFAALCVAGGAICPWLGPSVFLSYLPFFGLGMATAVVGWKPSRQLVNGALAALGLVLAALMLAPDGRALLLGGANASAEHALYNPPLNCVLALLLLPYAAGTIHRPSPARDAMWGDLSYIVYLLHWPAAVLVGHWFGALPPAERLLPLAASWAAVFGASYLIWRYYDEPINLMRRRFVEARRRA